MNYRRAGGNPNGMATQPDCKLACACILAPPPPSPPPPTPPNPPGCDSEAGGVAFGSECYYLGERGASCFATCAAVGRIFDIAGAQVPTDNRVCSRYFAPGVPESSGTILADGECCDYQVRDAGAGAMVAGPHLCSSMRACELRPLLPVPL